MVHLRTPGELRLEEAEASVLSSRRKELVLLAYLARRGARPLARAEWRPCSGPTGTSAGRGRRFARRC